MPAEERLLQIIFEDDTLAGQVFAHLKPEDYSGLRGEAIFTHLSSTFKKGKKPDFPEFKQAIDPELFSDLSEILLQPSKSASPDEIQDCLSALRQFSLSLKLKQLRSQIESLKSQGEQGKIEPILSEIMDINRHLYELSQRAH
jgi:replicative DNA helicase